ncbi:MAG: isoleucine--tRNA ligase [Saprospiraceae bacterium]
MYREFKTLDLPEIDREILAFWEAGNIFQRSITERDASRSFVFYEGPPSANGMPGIHHVMARTIKDIFCRYQTMKGRRVERKGGWDTHGLPIELSVEKSLGITRDDIGKTISVAAYNELCRKTVMQYKDRWDEITRSMGYWVDLDNPYITYTNDYIETCWWLLRQLYDKGLLYKGYTIQPFSPAAGTGLSSHELNQPGAYQDISDTTAVAQFRIKGTQNEYILAWTTTPWTLPSNAALAVGKDIVYVKVRTFNRYTQEPISVILAKDRMPAYFSECRPDLEPSEVKAGNKPIPYVEIVAEMTGAELEGTEYEQLMPYVVPDGPAFKVLIGDFVSTEDGTGIVHIAPTFGADDFRVGRQYGISAILVKDENGNPAPLVDRQGRFVKEVTDFAGRYVKDYGQQEERPVDVDIVIKLKAESKLFLSEKYVHPYPHCWRTGRPVLYYPLDSWFVRAASLKDRMYALNKEINWKPAATGEGRFGKWLENLQDWNLSRSRFWGVPLPIWRSRDARQEKCIGSVAELQGEIEKANSRLGLAQAVPEDLHRPFIDELVLVADDGAPLYREPDLIDVWFDSGAMPYAQWHYPFENQEKFRQNFPADFIAEGVDQTRGWFYTLHAIATMVFDSVAFKNVVSNGLVLDKNGVKMSKRLGNAVDPFTTIHAYGADATRWYMISNAQPWDNLRFDEAGIEEVKRRFFGTLFNTYSFFALYANIDGFNYAEADIPYGKRPEIDRWILSVLNALVQEVDADLAAYEPTEATRKMMYFVDEQLSNWYVRLCRRRFWKGDYSDDKIAAYQTLYECLIALAKLMAPISPFFADWLYRNLNEATGKAPHTSVHLALLPKPDPSCSDLALEQRMDYAQRISSLVLSLRKKEKIRVRQPLQKILLPVLDPAFIAQIDAVKDLILSEVNVKTIEYVTDTSGLINKRAKPNFKILGKRLGKDMKAAADLVASWGAAEIRQLETSGKISLQIGENSYETTVEDYEILTEDIPGWQVAVDGNITVALDTALSPELEAEGMARELVSKIQQIRKARGFNVTDKIDIEIGKHPDVALAVQWFGDYIREETLATSLSVTDHPAEGAEEVELVEGFRLPIRVGRA